MYRARPPSDAFLLHPRLLRDNSRNDPEAEATVVRWPGRLRFFSIVVEAARRQRAFLGTRVRDELSRQIARDPIKPHACPAPVRNRANVIAGVKRQVVDRKKKE